MTLFGEAPPPAPRRRRSVFAAVLAIAVVGVAAYLVLGGRGRDRAPSPGRSARPTPRASAPAGVSPSPDASRRHPEAPAAPTRARLQVDADVPGASVFLDRQYVGAAPLTLDDVEPGPHRLNVAADGYETCGENLDLAPGDRQVVVRFKEVRLDESVAAFHKHALGSCEGRLVATAEELRFEASSGNDSFRAPLAAVERFEMDYLRKNLLVRIRGGRAYNFTSRDGNPDPLYAFHRRVEKVRRHR